MPGPLLQCTSYALENRPSASVCLLLRCPGTLGSLVRPISGSEGGCRRLVHVRQRIILHGSPERTLCSVLWVSQGACVAKEVTCADRELHVRGPNLRRCRAKGADKLHPLLAIGTGDRQEESAEQCDFCRIHRYRHAVYLNYGRLDSPVHSSPP